VRPARWGVSSGAPHGEAWGVCLAAGQGYGSPGVPDVTETTIASPAEPPLPNQSPDGDLDDGLTGVESVNLLRVRLSSRNSTVGAHPSHLLQPLDPAAHGWVSAEQLSNPAASKRVCDHQ